MAKRPTRPKRIKADRPCGDADCKPASAANLNYLHRNGGRFLTVLPRTRKEHQAFRKRLLQGRIHWRTIQEEKNEEGQLADRSSAREEAAVSQ